ncbi:3-hydroxyacyl-CoA dehydrogenase family protein [Neobacillus cucumis]|uniref:3-hydroxyacyl-CoA dehydrogenase family protein n=1 Tax=Neobacillus cucumis TaxID=1740721 RepID=UPI00285327CA|nr:3-hydroxyacyl-CoA dehydrogenase NAD-binding domain-containing protein [Neobacillus cucumis]MDR4949228.1 3-hydroxyacyl-CoA dehydrogenase NAD-binding domain-containing protein [Neobacillus cucumis]
MNHERISIIGSGTMGHSIALSISLAGLDVKVWGNNQGDLERGKNGFLEKLEVLCRYNVITQEEAEKIKGRVVFTDVLEQCLQEATFIIEAIPETLALKQEWFQKLDHYCGPETILASNTSGLSPSDIALHTHYPERTVVTHFWNPAHLIPLVEIVRGKHTSDQTVERALALLKKINKKPIVVQKEILGAIGNRLQYALFREAQHILEQGAATMEDIDAAVRYSIGRRLAVTGPFLSADMGGLDVFESISSYLFPDLSASQTSLSAMNHCVEEGRYGQKNGAGFYEWNESFSKKMNDERERELIEWVKKDLKQLS